MFACLVCSVYLWKRTVFALCNGLFECFKNVSEFLNLKDLGDLCLTAAGCVLCRSAEASRNGW